MHKYATWMNITHPGQKLLYFDLFVGISFDITDCWLYVLKLLLFNIFIYWMIFALFGFYSFMFNKHHFSFDYCCCFILCTCIHIYVHTFIIIYLSIFFLNHCYVYLYCFMHILYGLVCRHKYVLCFAFTCSHVFCLFGLNSLGVHMQRWARVHLDGIDTKVNIFSMNRDFVCVYSQEA